MKAIIKITSFLLSLILVASLSAPIVFAEKATTDNRRTVRVAYPDQKYLTEIDDNGNYFGYSYEYLNKVAEFANWELEYVTYPNLSLNEQLVSAMEMVSSGEADLLGTMLRNEALEKAYLYPDNNYGAVYTTLETLETNLKITQSNYMNHKPLRIAIVEKAKQRNAELQAFLEDSGMQYSYVLCETVPEQVKALENGTADVMLNVSLTFLPGMKQVAQFAPRPFYFLSGLGNEALIAELDDAILKINKTDPYFEDRLKAKYFKNTIGDFTLSEKENAFVSENAKLKVLMLPQYGPFAFSGKDNALHGISVIILNAIGEKAGITFDYHVLQDGESVEEEIASGEYSVVLGPPHSIAFAQSYGLVLSQPYMEVNLTMYINKNAEQKPKKECVLALTKTPPDLIEYDYKDIKYYDTIEECLDAVNRGDADYGYADSYLVDFYTTQNSHKNLRYIDLTGYNREVGFFVPNTEKTELLSIINKYIRSMSVKDVHTNLALAIAHSENKGLGEFIQQNPLLVIAVAVAFIFLIMLTGMLALYNRTNKKRNQKLEQAFAAKSNFLSRMSHDMRTPMNGIIGLTGLTLDIDNMPEEAVDNLKKIDESAGYLLSLINDTLDMSRIESNKIVLNTEPTGLFEFFRQIMSVIQVSADQKNIHFVVTQGIKDGRMVDIDKVRVQQIMFNLLSNAIKFTPENGVVEVHGSCCAISETKTHTKLVVKDTGIGMTPEFLPKIFEPFEQEHNSTTANYGGSGLGLAIVKNLIDLMGGTITVKSELGKGTEFCVEIDFTVSADQQKSETLNEVSTSSLKGKRVLLCEDHPLNAQIAIKLLEKKEMLVEHASNGQLGVDMFEASAMGYYDAILMDIRMPVLDGLSAAAAIRKLNRLNAQSIPIIAMTANAFDEDVQKSLDAGMNAHLAKPIEPKKLYDALLLALSEQE